MLRRDTFALTALLALLTALGPLAMDLYLPSFPAIGRSLAASPSQVQLTISSYLIGFAVGQLVYGPVSDRFGRKPPLALALIVFCAGTLACAAAPGIVTLIAARAIQGIGASGVIVLARAVVRDLYDGPRAARELSLMAAIMGIVPILAPTAGGVLEELIGWRLGFGLILAAGGSAMLVVQRLLPETVPPRPADKRLGAAIFESCRIVFRHRGFLAHLGIVSASFAGLFAYISGSPFVMQDVYRLSPTGFGIFYGVTSIGFIIGTLAAARFVMRLGLDRTIAAGAWTQVAAAVGLIAAVSLTPDSLTALAVSMLLFLVGFGLAMPQAFAGALQPFPTHAGTASSLLGFAQQSISALVGAAVGLALGHSAWPMVIAVAASAFATFVIWATTRRVRATRFKLD